MEVKINKLLGSYTKYINKQYKNKRTTKAEYDIFYDFAEQINKQTERMINYISDIEMDNINLSLNSYKLTKDISDSKFKEVILKCNTGINKRLFATYDLFAENLIKKIDKVSNLIKVYNSALNKEYKKLDDEFIKNLQNDIKKFNNNYKHK